MPTRIVLQEPTPPSRMAAADTHHSHNHNHNYGGLTTDEEYAIQQLGNNDYSMGGESTRRTASTDGGPFQTPPRARTRFSNNNNHQHQHDSTPGSNSGSHRKVVGFRSSILRGTNNYTTNNNSNNNNTNYGDDDDDAMGRRLRRSNAGEDEAAKQRRLELNLSNEDIRASPRLLGYLFGSIAYIVMVVSVVQFYSKEDEAWAKSKDGLQNYSVGKFPDDTYFLTINGPIYLWKLWACVANASAGSFIFLLVLGMHFDTVCFPRTWFQVFRDGSLAERNILIGLIIFGAFGLHVNTSSFSVGEAQANVFFTSWIVFICTVLNLGVWRQSAHLPMLANKVLYHKRETTYNWCWTLLFNLITAGSATDMFLNREEITFRLKGEVLVLDLSSWMRVLAVAWSVVLSCIVAIFFNHVWTTTWKLKLSSECRFVLNWKFFEGLLILTMMGFKFWIILTYTGVGGVINGLNNTYFGIWGSFFNVVFTFGTWLRENRDIDYII